MIEIILVAYLVLATYLAINVIKPLWPFRGRLGPLVLIPVTFLAVAVIVYAIDRSELETLRSQDPAAYRAEMDRRAAEKAQKESEKGWINRAQFGDDWPFTVDRVRVFCDGSGNVVFPSVEVDGIRYALTGGAQAYSRSKRKDWKTLNSGTAVWRDHPTISGTKVSISPITDRAKTQCE